MDQTRTPLAEALKEQIDASFIPFDVPGHKGRLSILSDYFGYDCLALDFNSRKGIDNLCQPRGVIRQAEKLAAEAFGASNALFMVGGTTSSVQAMVMSACNPGEKIILPRNVHYSVINAVILAGAVPVYINPCVHDTVGISLGMSINEVEECIRTNRDAKAIFVNNPTYYGICSDIAGIVELAHKHNMLVLADEAHGTHFYFGDGLPKAAMLCGADMAAVSMHKTGGSLTQSSILLLSEGIDVDYVTNIINLTRTTSASYLLLASLDLARKFLATEGRTVINQNIRMAEMTRNRINSLGRYNAFGSEIIDGSSVFDFDKTKLSVNTLKLGLAGIEVYSLLRDDYGIQLEFGDTGNILALSTIGDTSDDHDKLIAAFADIRRRFEHKEPKSFSYEYITPQIIISPREAFYAKKKRRSITECKGAICSEAVMLYPPGIPILAPGEIITDKIIEHIVYASEKGCCVTGLLEGNAIMVVDC